MKPDDNPDPVPKEGNGDDTVPIESAEDAAASAISAANQARIRKRTKTGCLTCRKRRIKCGEERPICSNCIKSKRQCEGYNQRVVWKQPIGDWPQSGGIALTHHTSMMPGTRGQPQQQPLQQQPLPFLTPIQIPNGTSQIPMANSYVFSPEFNVPVPPWSAQPNMTGANNPFDLSIAVPGSGQSYIPGPQSAPPFAAPGFAGQYPPHEGQGISMPMPPSLQQTTQYYDGRYGLPPQQPAELAMQQAFYTGYLPVQQDQLSTFAQVVSPLEAGRLNGAPFSMPPSHEFRSILATSNDASTTFLSQFKAPESPAESKPHVQSEDVPSKIEEMPQSGSGLPTAQRPTFSAPDVSSGSALQTSPIMPGELLHQAAVEYEDDDYYDIDSDEEMGEPLDDNALVPTSRRDLGLIMALHRESNNEFAMRRYDAFIYEGILDTYRPERVASPLRNPRTARVFAHFCHATGPSLSIYERNPSKTSAFFSDDPVPYTQQSLWTYKLPMMALQHQGLLHAMLALASLHIAKLQGVSTTPSYKHYAYALKRIKHCISHPQKRYMVTTLAATLLLGFYEVMTASHGKWSTHLAGAKVLMVDLDFKGMTKGYRRLKAAELAQESGFAFENPDMVMNQQWMSQLQADSDINTSIDEGLVSNITGRHVAYDEFGHIEEVDGSRRRQKIPPQMDLSKYELFQDLFWWYCRQDAYHSILSGDKLLMDYSRWSDCPPRARMGRAEAIYGTHDHLILLLGRIADFSSRDRERKIKAIEANGGAWRPPMQPAAGPNGAGMTSPAGVNNMPPPMPQARQTPQTPSTPNHSFQAPSGFPSGQGPPSGMSSPFGPGAMPAGFAGPPPGMGGPPPGGIPQMPAFYGMAPSAGPPVTPSYYTPNKSNSPISPTTPQSTQSKPSRIENLEVATKAALQEWNSIKAALHTFEANFGPAYQPLPPESYQRLATPFGDAIQYRSYDIAVLWALYHMSHIITTRMHPSMPPAATVAAGVAAGQTAALANTIGRIAAGILPTPQDQPLNPSLGASLREVTLPLFFAGVQYQAAHQRAWLVSRIRDIGARTGWDSASMIAHGCETAWEKAFLIGKGPEYIRVRDQSSKDERIVGQKVEEDGGGRMYSYGYTKGGDADPFGDRRFVHYNPGARVHWAMGLLSLDDDIRIEGKAQGGGGSGEGNEAGGVKKLDGEEGDEVGRLLGQYRHQPVRQYQLPLETMQAQQQQHYQQQIGTGTQFQYVEDEADGAHQADGELIDHALYGHVQGQAQRQHSSYAPHTAQQYYTHPAQSQYQSQSQAQYASDLYTQRQVQNQGQGQAQNQVYTGQGN